MSSRCEENACLVLVRKIQIYQEKLHWCQKPSDQRDNSRLRYPLTSVVKM